MIRSFEGEHRWLSNFWPVKVEIYGRWYPSVENAYQAAKTVDVEQRKQFETCSAVQAKHLGKGLDIRPDWNAIKRDVMDTLCRQKFRQEPFRSQLLATGEQEIQEGNWWGDRYWGVCKGIGLNHLGRIIMRIRTELREE